MARLPFAKYEGLGNDFIVLDLAREADFDARSVPAMCDRHLGIGADGVLLVLPPMNGRSAGRMKVLNADGSAPEMCGNGLRCVALHLALLDPGIGAELEVETDAGPRHCVIMTRGPGEARVDVEMGVVRVIEKRRIELSRGSIEVTIVDAGNPHAVAAREDPEAEIEALGREIACHAAFPRGVNVELVAKRGDVLDVSVWERGVGRTRACGTGACAAVAEASARGGVASQGPVAVRLPGGMLAVEHDAQSRRTRLAGPARFVFRGELVAPGTANR